MNIAKTKSLIINETQDTPISLNKESIEDVSQFTYLGSIVCRTGGNEEDIKPQICKAKYAFAMLKQIWNSMTI